MKRLIILSELYYPEDTSTGYFITGIAEGLSRSGIDVMVICSKPNYREKHRRVEKSEVHEGVQIQRITPILANKNILFGRLWNIIILSWRYYLKLSKIIQPDDKILVVTNPPTLPWIVSKIRHVYRTNKILLIHDLYPDVFVPTGFLSKKNLIYQILDYIQTKILRSFSHIVVLGRDMKQLVDEKVGIPELKSTIIENWGDHEKINILPREENSLRDKYNLQDKFIIQFSGNLGRTHGINDLVTLAKYISVDPRFHFLVFGEGAQRNYLEALIADGSLSNVTLLSHCNREELSTYLNACDLFFLAFKDGMQGISVPSRMYNVMSAGNPILAVTSSDSEVAKVVTEEKIGWVVDPGDIDEMKIVIEEAYGNPQLLKEMRNRARKAVEDKYTKNAAIQKYYSLLKSIEIR